MDVKIRAGHVSFSRRLDVGPPSFEPDRACTDTATLHGSPSTSSPKLPRQQALNHLNTPYMPDVLPKAASSVNFNFAGQFQLP